MEIIYDPSVFLHNQDDCGEGNYRLVGLEDIGTVVTNLPDPTNAILRVHSPVHLRKFKGTCKSKFYLAEVKLSPESYPAAMTSVALSVYAAQTGEFAVTRPPGHHARKEIAAGFCFFNNIAIATQALIDQGKKVFIIDFDGHHGDGTEKLFYRTDKVFYSSIHREFCYPFKGGTSSSQGAGIGRGYNLNLPIESGSGDRELLSCLEQIAGHVQRFSPDVIGVSAGFDGYHKDRLLDLCYTRDGFSSAGSVIKDMGVPIFAVLEGGYHDDVMACVEAFVEGYNGV